MTFDIDPDALVRAGRASVGAAAAHRAGGSLEPVVPDDPGHRRGSPRVITENDVTLTIPRTWHARRNPAHGVILAARPRSVPAHGVCPEIVLRCTAVDIDLATWRGQALLDLRAQLADFALEDADEFDLGDHRVTYHRFAHRFAHRFGPTDVLCDQWAWLVDGLGVTLTCSVTREDYLTYCDLFETIAATVDVVPRLA